MRTFANLDAVLGFVPQRSNRLCNQLVTPAISLTMRTRSSVYSLDTELENLLASTDLRNQLLKHIAQDLSGRSVFS